MHGGKFQNNPAMPGRIKTTIQNKTSLRDIWNKQSGNLARWNR